MAGTFTGFEISESGSDQNIKLYQGKTITIPFIYGGDTPIDVTGYDARLQVRKSASSDTVIASFTVDDGRVSIGGANGAITLSMTAADSAALPAGSYVYDFEIIDDSGNVFLAMSGDCVIVAEVTR